MKVGELRRDLQYLDPAAEVRIALHPDCPLQYHVTRVALVRAEVPIPPDPQKFTTAEAFEEAHESWKRASARPDRDVVYMVEGGQVFSAPYLPSGAAQEIGW